MGKILEFPGNREPKKAEAEAETKAGAEVKVENTGSYKEVPVETINHPKNVINFDGAVDIIKSRRFGTTEEIRKKRIEDANAKKALEELKRIKRINDIANGTLWDPDDPNRPGYNG